MKYKLFAIAFFFVIQALQAQPTYQWVSMYDYVLKEDKALSVAVGSSGSTYAVGYVGTTVSPYTTGIARKITGDGSVSCFACNTGGADWRSVAVTGKWVWMTGKIKNGTDYDIRWVKVDTANSTICGVLDYNSSGSQNDEGVVIKIGTRGSVYTGGNTYTSSGGDFRIVKHIPSPSSCVINQTTAVPYNSGAGDTLVAMALDGSDNIYATGRTNGGASVLDFLTVKFDSTLGVQWARTYAGPSGTDYAVAVVPDNSGNVFVTGTVYNGTHGYDIATIKYNSSGTLQWAKLYNGTNNIDDFAGDITTDNTYLYVCGQAGGVGVVTIKYDIATGTQQWASTYSGSFGEKIKLDNSGNVYVAGDSPVFLLKFDNSGTFIEKKTFTSPYGGGGFTAMAVNSSGQFALVGDQDISEGSTNVDWLMFGYNAGGSFPAVASFVRNSLLVQEGNPNQYDLSQNYPNPFNPTTNIKFSLPEPGNISIKVYDVTGREVNTLIENQYFESGSHEIGFNGSQLASGAYFYRIVAANGKFHQVKKMMLIK
jgi:hypothetical protein